ncbi:MAG: SDR family oxidoreductase [Flavobacteriales bacterium]
MKKILVTGGSSGIGKAICELLAQSGNHVIGTSRNPEKSTPQGFEIVKMDVTDPMSIGLALEHISAEWNQLDVLINNAGIGFMGPLESAKAEHIKTAWETNVFGLMQVTQAFLPLLKKAEGRIINIGSIGGKMGLPFRGWYSAAKGSLEVLGESLAIELMPYKVEVCTLLPGDVSSNIADSRIEPSPEELGAYTENYKRMSEVLKHDMSSAMPPSEVAKAVEKLLRRKKLPLKHSVGSLLHKFIPILKNIIPQKWFQRLMMKHYK